MSGLNLKMCAIEQLILSMHEGASVYMRVSIAAARPQKSVADGFLRMFQLTPPVRLPTGKCRPKPYSLNDRF
jgi:hypothetical protein